MKAAAAVSDEVKKYITKLENQVKRSEQSIIHRRYKSGVLFRRYTPAFLQMRFIRVFFSMFPTVVADICSTIPNSTALAPKSRKVHRL
jgi:hypothetical protein